jgi:hypothetical protein
MTSVHFFTLPTPSLPPPPSETRQKFHVSISPTSRDIADECHHHDYTVAFLWPRAPRARNDDPAPPPRPPGLSF